MIVTAKIPMQNTMVAIILHQEEKQPILVVIFKNLGRQKS